MTSDGKNWSESFFGFLQRCDEHKISYDIRHQILHGAPPNAISVLTWAPGQYWEIDFYDDGEVNIEIFQSDGNVVADESLLEEFFRLHQDPDEQ